MIGASIAFFIGRYLGRDFAASLIGGSLGKCDEAIERTGFAMVLYLRLVYFPFTPMNFGMGLTRVRFLDYFFGTALGIIVGTFIFTFFVGRTPLRLLLSSIPRRQRDRSGKLAFEISRRGSLPIRPRMCAGLVV
jgi:uncharacterized membrane protein YdjX (TVP38/TMEM64 family)